jgi:hypothetical protein
LSSSGSRACAILLAGLALGLATSARAGDDGARTGAFADLEPGGRGAALAGALSPIVDDATAVHWNAARLIEVPGRAVAATYADVFGLGLVRHVAVFVALPRSGREIGWGRGTLTLQTERTHAAWGLGLQSTQVELDPENYSEYDLSLAYASRSFWGLSWGLVGHGLFARGDVAGVSASGFAADLALSRPLAANASASLVLRSLVSSVSWKNGTSESLVRAAELGVGLRPRPAWGVPATLTVDLDTGALRQAALGVEWTAVAPALTLRAGLRWRDDGERATLRGAGGVGLRWKEIAFDYGLAVGPSELGDTHRFSLHFGS